MASEEFKEGVTKRFNYLADVLKRRGLAKNNTAIAGLIKQPLQVVSKLRSGERLITLQQASELSKNANVSIDWLLLGEGETFKTSEATTVKTDDVLGKVAMGVARGELPEVLGNEIINMIGELRKENHKHKAEINLLNAKIIKMLELARKF